MSGVNNCKACIHRSEKKYANGTTDCGPQRVSLGYVCGAFSRGQAPLAAAGVLRRIKEAMRK